MLISLKLFHTPCVIDAYMEPVKYTENALDALVATSFINEVDIRSHGASSNKNKKASNAKLLTTYYHLVNS